MTKRLICILLLIGGGAGLLGGCEKALFPKNMPRTQYERYDRLRGRYVPAHEMNIYGGDRPALRERLSPPQN